VCNSYEDVMETICWNAIDRGIGSSSIGARLTETCEIHDQLGNSVVKGAIDFGLDAEQERVKESFMTFVGSDNNSDAMINTTTNNCLGFRRRINCMFE